MRSSSTRGAVVAALAPILAALLVSPVAYASELWRHGDAFVEVSGSIRQLVRAGRQTDSKDFQRAADATCLQAATFASCPAFGEVGKKDSWQSLTRVRTRVELQAFEGLHAVVVYDHELLGGILDTFEGDLGRGFGRNDFFDAESSITRSSRADWRHLLYRGYLELETEKLNLIAGRQRVAWGVGRLWNPIDRFSAIPPLAVQRDQSQGVDSLLARYSFDGFNFAEAVYSPGTRGPQARYGLRLHGVLFDSDLSLMGGVFEQAPTVGVDFARNVGGAAFRVEAVYTDPKQTVWQIEKSSPGEVDDFWQVVVSADYNFDFGDGVYLLVEHLYNGNALGFGRGEAGSLLPLFEATNVPPAGVPPVLPGPYPKSGSVDLFGTSRVVTAADHLTGLQTGTDLTPELRLELLSIYDWDGQSAAFAPSIKYSPLGSFEVTIGVQAFAGRDRSQYGDAKTFGYVLADFFF